ncbi:acetylornithine deacetylase-like protein [Plenodomus tracheiphilus IPT5]|uniref:Acetylornithine deacetylase-like protein n=1 Tax=Plenodomus tracheiphilus IPT5 TaxID=1408161 RepID=A0A6A7BA40_9PLEO|nr:acetylornithine deacetylase-like protein [Plenodomus tracheiphilus IPT5]
MVRITALWSLCFFSLVCAAPQGSQPSVSASSIAPNSSGADEAVALTAEERDELFSLHEELVNIPSISADEVECAEFISEYLKELGYYVEEVPEEGTGAYNVFAYPQSLKDAGVWPEVLITSHIDTVPPFYPFDRREENGTVYHYGRGTVDAKGPVASMIISAHKFFETQTSTPSLGMLFVVSEETGGAGMRAFASYASNTTFRAGIFGEPTELKLASGHKGTLRLTLSVKGKASHSAYPWLGVSAINYLSEAVVALNSLEPALPQSELLGPTTLNTGVIQGGIAANVVPESANASISIRISRSEDDAVQNVKNMIEGMLSPIVTRAEAANRSFSIEWANTTYAAPILDTDIEGLEVAPVFYGTDIPNLPQVEKRYLFGAGTIQVAHTPDEGLDREELVQAAEAYGKILRGLFEE